MTERNPFYSVADLLGVNCADRTDKVIAEEMLTEIEHLLMRRPIDFEGQPVRLGAYEVDDCGDWVFCTVVGLAENNRVVIDVPGYEHWQTINAHRIREAPGADDFGNELPRTYRKSDSCCLSVKVGLVETFPNVEPSKKQVLKISEEVMEVFSAWENWRDDPDAWAKKLCDEIADVIQASCNLIAALGLDDFTPEMERCRKRNADRGRF